MEVPKREQNAYSDWRFDDKYTFTTRKILQK